MCGILIPKSKLLNLPSSCSQRKKSIQLEGKHMQQIVAEIVLCIVFGSLTFEFVCRKRLALPRVTSKEIAKELAFVLFDNH